MAHAAGVDPERNRICRRVWQLDHSPTTNVGIGRLDRSRIQVESEILLPFASDVAFDAFADLRRQPSFSKWLKSVDYIDGSTTNQVGSRSKWTVSFSGLRFSWQAESKQLDRHRGIIEWGSVTGMRNEGMLVLVGGARFVETQFLSLNPPNFDAHSGKVQFRKGEDGMSTHMRLSMCIHLPKFAARVMGASSGEKVARLIEQRMLVPTLESFRQLVVQDNEEAKAAQTASNTAANNMENNNTFEQRFEMMQDELYEYRPKLTFPNNHPLEEKQEEEEDTLQQFMVGSSRFSPVVPQDS
jgi:uncharacterized membrane protein